jgi:hypothetical protein
LRLEDGAAPQLLEWMLPNTSVIGAPSMRMRVGSLIDRTASTATPSRASSTCSAVAGAAAASRPVRAAHAATERNQQCRNRAP